ncbi:NfeD family protein [Rhodovastum atsumiense]|uniref:NfeD family protein n=1 Tax=Rhodovastum atsumiense TaxID=504468 RepID=A0A5M6IR72_9PROT|nr:NfeD family protein [Rhodovastum atsumiense]KAA5610782.1 NfeD family protein [Rhodovastum atsumiense]CAH2604452.1 NfeD family protein [Rhodovastum atsumiense]
MITIEPALLWLAAGLTLLGAEVFIPGAFLMWVGLAALGTGGLVLAVTPGFAVQVSCFAVLSAASIAIALRLRRRPRARPGVNTPDSGLVGRTAQALSFRGREGRVRLGDSDWPAQLAAGAAVPEPDAILRVVGVRGLVLVVEPAKPAGMTEPSRA